MHMGISVGLRRGGNISVDLSLFVLPYDTYFMNKLKFNDFGLTKNERKKISLAAQIISIYKSPHSTFHSEERLLFFKKKGRACFVGLSIYY